VPGECLLYVLLDLGGGGGVRAEKDGKLRDGVVGWSFGQGLDCEMVEAWMIFKRDRFCLLQGYFF